ncbi:TIGR03086 family protein [Gordonia rubripertincta]|uniref:TIGR03086 family protein n=1 Tax=Gordonia rubripertincta TaxID=36822 RepID=A0AAW4G0Q3_GORRU|nr:TIGR03086 family metal-binding protein [Gordonia rubripertincta]MBM7276815.1 TIGR03086 family protein [Gordonia rubripertincta]
MNAPTTPPDPRPAFAAATTWVTGLLSEVTAEQLAAPTPCDEFDVRTLGAHLLATAQRAAALPEGVDVRAMPFIADRFDAQEYATVVARAVDLWSDDATLARMVQVPWGEVPGAGALWGYVNETIVHGWDLAVATGQTSEAVPEAATDTLAIVRRFIRPEIRQDPNVPFGSVVVPRPGAGPTERLANWSGRDATSWSQTLPN